MPDTLSSEQQIVASLRQIMRAVDLHSRRLVESCGLTGPQLTTLQLAARLGNATPSIIARRVHLSQATVTGILQRLESRGLIARQPSTTDRRSISISVTSAGQALLDAAPSLLQDQFRDQLRTLEPWEQQMILATLQRVAGLMGAEKIDAAPHLLSQTMR